jgi:hypothetical protein
MNETNKWYAHNDGIKMADVLEQEAPKDKFKSTYEPRVYKNKVLEKVTSQTHWAKTEDQAVAADHVTK